MPLYILHFDGQGYGMMSGVSEYLTLHEEPPTAEDQEPAPGFELVRMYNTDIDDEFTGLPLDRILKAGL